VKTTLSILAALFGFFWCSISAAAQTVQVDITPAHATNRFVPNQTLGAGVDRIAQGLSTKAWRSRRSIRL